MQKGFEDAEIAQTQACGLNTAARVRFYGLRCLPQQQPQVDSGGVKGGTLSDWTPYLHLT
ncbi:MAG: hypothetical protein ACRD3O_04300 [Terriglobia bacterium]